MLQIYPQYEGLVSLDSVGRIGSIKTLNLSQDIYSKVFPESKTPSIDELRRSFMEEASIYSNPILRNFRLFPSGFRIPTLQSSDGLPIYTTSMKKLREGYIVGALTKGYFFDTYF